MLTVTPTLAEDPGLDGREIWVDLGDDQAGPHNPWLWGTTCRLSYTLSFFSNVLRSCVKPNQHVNVRQAPFLPLLPGGERNAVSKNLVLEHVVHENVDLFVKHSFDNDHEIKFT